MKMIDKSATFCLLKVYIKIAIDPATVSQEMEPLIYHGKKDDNLAIEPV